MNHRIEEFDVFSAPDKTWDAFFWHGEEIYRELDPEDSLPPREKSRARLVSSHSIPYVKRRILLLFPEDAPGVAAGLASFSVETPRSPSYETNKRVCNLNISVLPEYRGRGYGAALLRRTVEELAVAPSVTEFLAFAALERGRRFLSKAGGTVSLEQAENRLYFKDLDWKMVESWAAEGAKRNPATELLTVSIIPAEDIKDFCEVYSDTMNQQPFGDISIRVKYTPEMLRLSEEKEKKDGVVRLTLYARESDGKVSGLTEIYYAPDVGHKVRQMLTGVRKECRGRGLGKLLKASMLLSIREKYPSVRYVTTANADSNAPMMAINKQLGFKRHRAFLIYKLKIAEIRFR